MEKVEQGMVSVVIPYYNRRNCIIGSLKSVLNQTYSNLEVIIVDDGSAESAEDILAPYLGERVRYHRYTPNRGACHARNTGAALAKGEFIAFHDSDDFWYPQKLEKQLAYMKKGNWDFVFCGKTSRAVNNDPAHCVPYYPQFPFDDKANAAAQLLYRNYVTTQTILIKRAVAEVIQFDENLSKYQDWDYAITAALHGVKIGYLAEPLVDAEVQLDSISMTVKAGPVREQLYQKYKAELEKYPKAHAKFLEEMARCFKASDHKKAAYYLRMSMGVEFTPKRCLKYLLTEAGLMK